MSGASTGSGSAAGDESKHSGETGHRHTGLARFCQTASAQEYLDHFDVEFYLGDATALLLKNKEPEPAKFLKMYFESVLRGSHVVNREFAYLHANVRNRLAFVRHATKAFEKVGQGDTDDEPLYTFRDLAHLVGLVCDDFPQALVEATAHIMGKSSTTDVVPVTHGLRAVLTVFLFTEFFAEMREFAAVPDLYSPVGVGAAASGGGRRSPGRISELPVPGRAYKLTSLARSRWPLHSDSDFNPKEFASARLPASVWDLLSKRTTDRVACLWCPPVNLLQEVVPTEEHPGVGLQSFLQAVCSHKRVQAYIHASSSQRLRGSRNATASAVIDVPTLAAPPSRGR